MGEASVSDFVRFRALVVSIGCIGLIAVATVPSVATKNGACRAGCKTEQRACRDANEDAFQTTKSDCTGSGKAKICGDDGDCPPGKTCLFSCGQPAQQSSYLGYCNETTICSK